MEQRTLLALSKIDDCVIATGGGVVLREANRDCLMANGFVAWLTATPATIWDRMQVDPTTRERRPALAQGGIAEVEELLRKREPYYRECAHLTLDGGALSPEALAAAILAEWETSTSSSS